MTMSEQNWPDLAGRLEGARHSLPIRVYFEDTDFSGLVYHTSYLRWCERGRSDMLRLIGVHHNELHDGAGAGEPAAFVVRHMAVDYLRPARIDEILEVVTECAELGGAHIMLSQHIRRGDQVLCRLMVKVVLLGLSGKPQRLPATIRQKIKTTNSSSGK